LDCVMNNWKSENRPFDSPNTSVYHGQEPILVVPEHSPLGDHLFRSLCAPCFALKVSTTDVEACHGDSLLVLERLVAAHCLGMYVQRGETMSISYTGKTVELKVESVVGAVGEEQDLEIVETAFQALSIDETMGVAGDRALVSNRLATYSGKLYQITHETNVSVSLPEGRSDGKDTNDSALSGQEPHDRPQQFVAGLDATVNDIVAQLRIPLFRYDWLQKRGLQVPRGVLIYGVSGKTCVARQVAQNLGCDYEYIHCATLKAMSSVVGQAESRLLKIFSTRSLQHKRSLVILDDIHLICPKRGDRTSGDHLAATLLSVIDGVEYSPVVLLAVTPNPAALDPALRRPGRLDYEIEVPLPDDLSSRAAILHFHARRLGFLDGPGSQSDYDWVGLAKLAKGFHGGDCMIAMKEAGRSAFLNGSSCPSLRDLEAAIRSTKPSAIKSIAVEIPEVRWTDIGGMDDVKQALKQVLRPPSSNHKMLAPPKGVLLYGPPGCSKTLMARALAAESQMNFLAVKGPELLSKWLGESERSLASLFRRARMASPSIIFFDEIDAIAVKRGSNDSASSGRLLSQLLTELDGVGTDESRRVIVVAATNRPDLLDSALVRPGRIDRKIYVGTPDYESRRKILQLTLKHKACSDDVDIDTLAMKTDGCSGAELVALCRDAALFALENDEKNPQLTMDHLEKANLDLKRQITKEMLHFYETYTAQPR
jgi:SpoVK/Ycf46/Vps4 family AAA+-type ATPase